MTYQRLANCARHLPVLAATVVVLLGGCGDPERPQGTLAGTVTYRGQPVTGMDVAVYRPNSGINTTTPLDADGRFEVEAPIPVGSYSLAVVGRPMVDPSARGPRGPAVPRKYLDLKTSGLTAEVQKGRNDVVIELTD